MKTIIQDAHAKLDSAQSLFETGIENIRQAGAILADLVNNHRYTVEMIVNYYASKASGGNYHHSSSRHLIESLVRIGNKQLHPALLFSAMAPARAMMSLPFADQERLLDAGSVEVAVVNTLGGDAGILNVPLESMTREQVKQVFSKSEIRPPGAQRAWLSTQITKGAIKAQAQRTATNGVPYRINSKGQFEVPAVGLVLGATDLLSILAQMEAKRR